MWVEEVTSNIFNFVRIMTELFLGKSDAMIKKSLNSKKYHFFKAI